MSALTYFLTYLQTEKRMSVHTIESYQIDLKQFSVFIHFYFHLDNIEDADSDMIRAWIVDLMDKKHCTTRTVNRKISTLKAFYTYIIKMGKREKNPMTKIMAPKMSKRLPVFMDYNTIQRLFSADMFTDDFSGWRDRTVMETFYDTGIRRAELIGLKYANIDFYEGTIKVLGKRNKERVIPFGKSLDEAFRKYFKLYHEKWDLNQNSSIFVSDKGKRLTPVQVSKIVHKYLDMVTTIEKRSPHVIRHTFATHLLDQGADINAIKELLGHTNLAATQIYTHNTISKLKAIYKQAHPRAEK